MLELDIELTEQKNSIVYQESSKGSRFKALFNTFYLY